MKLNTIKENESLLTVEVKNIKDKTVTIDKETGEQKMNNYE